MGNAQGDYRPYGDTVYYHYDPVPDPSDYDIETASGERMRIVKRYPSITGGTSDFSLPCLFCLGIFALLVGAFVWWDNSLGAHPELTVHKVVKGIAITFYALAGCCILSGFARLIYLMKNDRDLCVC